MVKAMAQCSLWLQCDAAKSPPGTNDLKGKAAAEAINKKVEAAGRGHLKQHMDSIKELQVFGWLLREQDGVIVEGLKKDAVSEDLATGSAARVAEEKTKPKAGRKRVAPSGRDAVLALLSQ